MINKPSIKPVFVLLSAITLTIVGCGGGPVPTSEELVTKYPDVGQNSSRAENKEILCPFVRMLERSGSFDEEVASLPTITITTKSLGTAAKEFGCATSACQIVANIASSGQGNPGVDIERLHDADTIAHDCGLTYGFGDTQVNDAVRQNTLDRLADLADNEGNLVYADLETVKLENCAAEGVEISSPGELETKLIFAYLGGVENGSIPLSDVERLFHATMPENKTTSWLNSGLLGKVK